jgi:hypothetical protein
MHDIATATCNLGNPTEQNESILPTVCPDDWHTQPHSKHLLEVFDHFANGGGWQVARTCDVIVSLYHNRHKT